MNIKILDNSIFMLRAYQALRNDKKLLISRCFALIMIAGSFVINFYAGTYADKSESNSVTDIILSNIPVYQVDDLFTYGIRAFALFMIMWSIRYPRQMPYIIKSIALFIIIRALFVSLTHIGPFPIRSSIEDTDFISKMNFWADLFFSGHTWLPFLLWLIFWQHRWYFLRYVFIIASVMFGVIVLLGHLHYSIDVLAAFFITYAINDINKLIFVHDKRVFDLDVLKEEEILKK